MTRFEHDSSLCQIGLIVVFLSFCGGGGMLAFDIDALRQSVTLPMFNQMQYRTRWRYQRLGVTTKLTNMSGKPRVGVPVDNYCKCERRTITQFSECITMMIFLYIN